jgi:hypothetical protein
VFQGGRRVGTITADAQKYTLAHQISLIDLSGASFSWRLIIIGSTAVVPFGGPCICYRSGNAADNGPTDHDR